MGSPLWQSLGKRHLSTHSHPSFCLSFLSFTLIPGFLWDCGSLIWAQTHSTIDSSKTKNAPTKKKKKEKRKKESLESTVCLKVYLFHTLSLDHRFDQTHAHRVYSTILFYFHSVSLPPMQFGAPLSQPINSAPGVYCSEMSAWVVVTFRGAHRLMIAVWQSQAPCLSMFTVLMPK